MAHQYHRPSPQRGQDRPKRPPGGALPEGWEYFRDCQQPVWLGLPAKSQEGASGLLVFGLLPIKCPLAPVFERQLAQKAADELSSEGEYYDDDDDDYPTASTERRRDSGRETREQRCVAERERLSRARYFARLPVERLQERINARLVEAAAAKAAATGSGSGMARLKIRAVINLCATDRYYDPADLAAQGIQFERFFFEGGGKTLSEQKINALLDVVVRLGFQVGSFFVGKTSKDLRAIVAARAAQEAPAPPLPVVAIHCTHGVNRTGYCVIMILFMLGLQSLKQGLDIFYHARGHDLNKLEFIEHLKDVWSNHNAPAQYRTLRSRVYKDAAFFV